MLIESRSGRRNRLRVLDVKARLLDRIWLRRCSSGEGKSPNSSISLILSATFWTRDVSIQIMAVVRRGFKKKGGAWTHTFVHISAKLKAPCWAIPSSRLL